VTRTPLRPDHRRRIWLRDGGLCAICGLVTDPARFHVDHVVAVCAGGTNDDANLRTTHPACNYRKAGPERVRFGQRRVRSNDGVKIVSVRMPMSLVERLQAEADKQRRPLSNYIVVVLEQALASVKEN
jgi:hypothetical protein